MPEPSMRTTNSSRFRTLRAPLTRDGQIGPPGSDLFTTLKVLRARLSVVARVESLRIGLQLAVAKTVSGNELGASDKCLGG
jgi:hypothetical protein